MTVLDGPPLPTTFPASARGYSDIGVGGPAVLCIPAWCGDRSVFDRVAAGLGAHRRVLRTDLPEHGTRPRTGVDFTTADVVTDLAALLDDCGVEQVVPVALSHAGWVAIELRRLLGPRRVPGIVVVDWPLSAPPQPVTDALVGLQDPQRWASARTGLLDLWSAGPGIPALRAYLDTMAGYGAAHWQRAGREIATAFAANGSPMAALEELEVPCPTLHLCARGVADSPADSPADDAAQLAYAAAHPWLRVHRLRARSHFPLFEVPGETAGVIEEFTCRLS